MCDGIVKWFNRERGFGFINQNGRQIFVHYSDIVTDGIQTLSDGDKVKFKTQEGKFGLCAKKVVKCE